MQHGLASWTVRSYVLARPGDRRLAVGGESDVCPEVD
jgi:hypothetical protein